MKNKEFEKTVTRVNKINQRLKQKGFDWNEIDEFWTNIFQLKEGIEKAGGIEYIKVCKNCGHLDIEETILAGSCCEKPNYVHIARTS